MIRLTTPNDTDALVRLADETAVFKPREIVALREVLDDYHATMHAYGDRAITYEKNGEILGFAYFAPAPMADRTWHLYWIAVAKTTQARGIGTELLRYSECEVAKAGCRLYLIETSLLPIYEKTRNFYLKHDYEQHAVIDDYYADGDSMVIFRKHF